MKWEYKMIQSDNFFRVDELNKQGQDGWELVWIKPGYFRYQASTYVFKRQVKE